MKKVWIFFCFAGSYCQKWLFWCLGAMTAIQAVTFGIGLGNHTAFDGTISPYWMQGSFITAVMVMMLRMTALGSGGKQPSYLMKRIDTPKHQIFLGFFSYALLTFFLLWALQVALLWAFALIYTWLRPENMAPQTLFLLTHNVDFFHVLLPTIDTTQLAFTILSWVGLSMACGNAWQKKILPICLYGCFTSLFLNTGFSYFAVIAGQLITIYHTIVGWKEELCE